MLADEFKAAIQAWLGERYLEESKLLINPAVPETAHDLHEIGRLRGYLKALREASEEIDEIFKQLIEGKAA